MPRSNNLAIKIQLFAGAERAFGPGRADVLEAIDREGSISAAGRSLGMSYRFTWMLVNSMNGCFRQKLVEATTGGKRGGSATLTDAGRAVLASYRSLERQVMRASQGKDVALLDSLLRPEAVDGSAAD